MVGLILSLLLTACSRFDAAEYERFVAACQKYDFTVKQCEGFWVFDNRPKKPE